MTTPTPTKRRKFTDKEDVMLLRQINAERPFEARQGEIMKVWASIAQALSEQVDFVRPAFDAKKAQHRFGVLIEGHRAYDRESARASGVSEEYDEKLQLLDELLSALDDTKAEEKERSSRALIDNQRMESEGEIVRASALASLGKRKAEHGETEVTMNGGGRVLKLFNAIQDDAKTDLDFRKEELEF
ncbi:hypothetical protein AC1031_011762 [Aphanomyces cochlioides]|nr:hypothetical protein AC1031_011762 [Aphanomyces cochlioides]